MTTQRLLDVWILEGNTVYRGVPFTVVADWLQQGRLLPEDRVSISGGKKWLSIIEVSAFQAFLPKSDAMDAEDAAEAHEPVDMGLNWGKRREEEDDDVDMIPLIDVSLVLLIFFMMTASVATGIISPINTPPAEHQTAEIATDMLWVGVDSKSGSGLVERGPDGKEIPWLSFGDESGTFLMPTTQLVELERAIKQRVDERDGPVRIRIRGDLNLPIEVIQDVTLELQGLEKSINASRPGRAPLSFVILAEVSEPKH